MDERRLSNDFKLIEPYEKRAKIRSIRVICVLLIIA
jgi:hypothetical protein